MKKTLCALMILILIVSLVSCQETEKTLSVSVTELGEKVEEKMASETVADYDATLLLDDLGIASSLYTEYFYKVGSSDASVEEVAFFKAADEESATTIMQKLQSRKASTESTQKDYNAENYDIAVNATVETDGLYVYMVMSANRTDINSVIADSFK